MRSLKEIVDDYAAVNAEAQRYWSTMIAPRVAACKNREEFIRLHNEVCLEAADAEGQFRDLPAAIGVALIVAASKFREEEPGPGMSGPG